ncbi:MAG: hypothetical protein DMG35_04975 [Acidobacteria bacterium]|nr:MAG: hypothetical protein DMG35_04975 [Acidobacteriota bacterium]
MNVAKLQKLKSQAAQLLREHEALLTLSCLIGTERAKLFVRSREELGLAGSVNKLQMYVQHEGQIVNELRRLLGASVSNSQLLASLDSMKAAASKMVEGGKKNPWILHCKFCLATMVPECWTAHTKLQRPSKSCKDLNQNSA